MTFSAQMELVGETEAGGVVSYSTFSASSLPALFSLTQEAISLDYGSEVPAAITLIIAKVPTHDQDHVHGSGPAL